MRNLLAGLFGERLEPAVIHCDNHICINILKKTVFHDKLKHIEMNYHIIRYMVQKSTMKLQYIDIEEKIAYVLINPLLLTKFRYFQDNIGLTKNSSLAKREC